MAIGLGSGAFVAGMVLLAAVLLGAGASGLLVARRVAPGLRGLEAGLAWALCATAALLVAHEVPLALGVLSRATVLVATVVVLAAALLVGRRDLRPSSQGRAAAPGARRAGHGAAGGRRRPSVAGVAAWAGAALVAGAALAYLRAQVAQPITSSDALNFQVPQVVRWMQTGSMWQLDQFFPGYSNATYPHHGNVLVLAAVLPFDSAFLVRLVAVPFAVMAALAVVAGARALGASAAWAVLAAALLAAVPTLGKVALDGAQTDAPMLAFLGAGAVFLLRHQRTGDRGDLALAALGLGLALGTKWYALTTIPAVAAVWLVARLASGAGVRRAARQAAALVAGTLLAGGIWLVRNWTQTGNPLYPQPLGPFDAPRDTIREQAGFTLAHYLRDGAVWSRYLRPTFDAFLAGPGYVLLAAPLVVLVVAAARRSWGAAAAGAAGLLLLAGYVVTPYSAFGPEGAPLLAFASVRYALPAALAGAVGVAWLGTRAPRPVGAVLAVLALAAVLLGVREQYRPAVSWPAILLAAAVLAVLAWGWGTSRAAWGAKVPHPRLVGVTGAVVVALAGAALVRDRAQTGYGTADPVLAAVADPAAPARRIALAGQWDVTGVSPVLPSFGPRLRNRVAYAGPFQQHLLRRDAGARSFTARVRGADLLVVGLEGDPPELRWARAAGWRPVAASRRLALLAPPA